MDIENEMLDEPQAKNPNLANAQGFNENKTTKNINKLLQLNNRKEALMEFESFIKSCNDSSFSENCVKWLQLCCKSANGNISEDVSGLKLFSKIVILSAEFPELGRQMSHSVTSRFLEVFSKYFSCYQEGWNALETLLLKYHGSFATHKELLENLLRSQLNGTEILLLDHARCFALFPLAGGGGTKNTIYKSNWREQFDKLLHTCHNLLNILFEDIDELHTYDVPCGIAFTLPEEDILKKLITMLTSCCLILQSMLLGPYPSAKMVPVDAALKLISRCLSISEVALKNKKALITEEFYTYLPQVHCNMVQTLSALVVCCKKTLLPVSTTISKLLEQALQNASASKKLGISVYSCLSNWLVSAEGGSSLNHLKKSIIPILLDDIQQKRGVVLLRGKDKSKQAVRDKLNQFGSDENLCFAALKTLETLLNSVGYKLEAHQHKMLQSVLLGIAFDLERESTGTKWINRSSIRCREALYFVIIQLCLEPCLQWPPPTQYVIKILKNGLNDCSPSVATTCLRGITMIQRIIYPEFSIGSFPLNYQNVAQETESRLNESPAMEVDLVGNGDTQNKTAVKLVTKTCSPWQSLTFKNNVPDTSSNDSNELNVLASPRKSVRELSADYQTSLTVLREYTSLGSQQSDEIQSQAKNDNSLSPMKKPELAIEIELFVDETTTQKRKGSISSQSSIAMESKNAVELDSPMSLRSGTVLGSPSPSESLGHPRTNNDSSTISSCEPNTIPSPIALKKTSISGSKEDIRTPRSSSVSPAVNDIGTPMSLRSGTLVGSQNSNDGARLTRRGSVSSQSSISLSQPKFEPSPVLEEIEMDTFDDTVRDDYY